MIHFDSKGDIGRDERQNPPPRGFVEVWGYASLIEYLKRHPVTFRIVFHPLPGTVIVEKKKRNRVEYEFECVCRLVWAIKNVVFSIDEIWLFTSAGWMPDALYALVNMGRTPGITLLWTAQRPQDVARGLTALTTSWRIFRVEEPADLAALPRSIPPELWKQIPSLPDRVYLARDGAAAWVRSA